LGVVVAANENRRRGLSPQGQPLTQSSGGVVPSTVQPRRPP
jgi:hypothetical protein